MPTYRAQANSGADALISNPSVTTPGTVVSGDVAVFWLSRWDGSSFPAVTPPSGAVLRGTIASGAVQTQVYLLKVTSETSFTFTWTGARWTNLTAHFFAGVDSALDLSTVPFNSATGTGTSVTTLTVTTVATAALSYGINTLDYAGTTTHGPPTSFTETSDFDGTSAAYYISPADGSQSAASATISSSQLWAAGLVALAPAAGGGGATPSDTDTGSGAESQTLAMSDTDTGTGGEGTPNIGVSDVETSAGASTEALSVIPADETSTGADTESIAATNSDTDVGAAGEGVPIISVSDGDTSAAVDTESTVQGASDSDTPTSADTESLAAALSDTDTASGAESAVISVSDTDTSSAVDSESVNTGGATASDSDTSGGADTESVNAAVSDADTAAGADTESLAATTSSSDTSSGVDTESVVQGTTDSETNTGADTESIAASNSDTETAAGADTESIAATSSDSDTSAGSETYALTVQVSDTDTSNATESATASIVATTSPGDSDTESASESWSIAILNAPIAERSLVLGPATLYIASYGAVEPANGVVSYAPDPLVWTDLGGTLGGVDLTVEQEWITVELKQLPDQPMRRLKSRRMSVKVALAEPTLANLGYALNDTTSTTAGSGWSAFAPQNRSEASQLSYSALIVDGWCPGFEPGGQHKRRRLIIRKCLSSDNVEMGYNKDGQTTYSVTWTCHYVNSTTAPFRVIDAD